MEVPIVENVIRKIPKRQIVELPKIVPKYEVEYVERLVETPQVKYVDRVVEKPIPHEVIVSVPVVQVQEVPREVIKHVPKIVMEIKESQVNVPGQVIEVPKPYIVENKVGVKRWIDKKVPIVVAQTIRPVVVESSEKVDVDVCKFDLRNY